jgi:hypothetical protein
MRGNRAQSLGSHGIHQNRADAKRDWPDKRPSGLGWAYVSVGRSMTTCFYGPTTQSSGRPTAHALWCCVAQYLWAAAHRWRCYDFRSQALGTTVSSLHEVFYPRCIRRAGASNIRRLTPPRSVGWVAPYLPPSGACLMTAMDSLWTSKRL